MRRKFAVFLSIMIMLGQGCRNRNVSIQWSPDSYMSNVGSVRLASARSGFINVRHDYGDYGCCLLFVRRLHSNRVQYYRDVHPLSLHTHTHTRIYTSRDISGITQYVNP
ncbi:hypothetical protein GGU10DRAFT_366832 [Lentinula aff. detonsa]|uniref:Uncharacterized protein n=1 Tax=Lentinula aff. detonsa TaxID=2804958 RepID=A0AA38NBK6_9AGAR|nr:hypothetical protein GGU10DRAFT_366832 [Lentinula aff. detonsa]